MTDGIHEEEQLEELLCYMRRAEELKFDEEGRVKTKHLLLEGLVKFRLQQYELEQLRDVNRTIITEIQKNGTMAPWVGVGGDSLRLRAFGFLNQRSRDRIDQLGIRLHDSEMVGEEAKVDEMANKTASMVLEGAMQEKAGVAASKVIELLRKALPSEKDVISLNELVAFQPNLHNGAAFLKAHLDYPRHEGFGKVIATVAIEQSATVILLGPPIKGKGGEHQAWRFTVSVIVDLVWDPSRGWWEGAVFFTFISKVEVLFFRRIKALSKPGDVPLIVVGFKYVAITFDQIVVSVFPY